jgi:hypothetical protein
MDSQSSPIRALVSRRFQAKTVAPEQGGPLRPPVPDHRVHLTLVGTVADPALFFDITSEHFLFFLTNEPLNLEPGTIHY